MFTGRSVALFIHLMGVITLFIAMGLVQRVGIRMRAAETIGELRLWLSLMKTTGSMWPSAFAFLLLSGLYMTNAAWTFQTPWIVTGIGSLILIGVVGGAVVGRGFASLGKQAASAGELTADLRSRVNNPGLWIGATALNGMAMGVLWLMVNKPGWVQSLGVVVVLGLVGAAAGAIMTRRSGGQR